MNGLATKLPDIFKILLIVGIVYTLVSTVWYFVSGPVQASATPIAGVNQSRPAGPVADIQRIISGNIFGDVSAAPAVAQQEQQNDEPAKETRLPLTLLGVFQATHEEDSAAIVAQKGKAGLRYTVGDTMPGNADLVEVHADHIILRRAGVRETLRFPKSDSLLSSADDGSGQDQRASANGAPGAAVGRARITPPTRRRSSREPPSGRGQSQLTGQNQASTSAIVAEINERLEQDPEGTLESIGVEPVSAGNSQGYRLGALASNPLLANTGLQSSDVLLSVNNEPVGDIRQDRQRISSLMAEGTARLEVMRGERRFFVTAALP